MATAKKNPAGNPVQGQPIPKLLTVPDVAELLAVSQTTVYRLKQSGQISFLKVRGALRFRPQDVADYQNRQAVTALGYPANEDADPPRLNLAFPLKRRGSGKI